MDDVNKLLAYIDENNIDPTNCAPRGWDHMGAIIADAVLQQRNRYEPTVRSRVESIISDWPDAKTTSGLQKRIAAGGLAEVIRWTGEDRLHEVEEIADVLSELGIETHDELSAALSSDPRRTEVRAALGKVKHVGPKTLDYFDILVGYSGTAIDDRIRCVADYAGIHDLSYDHLHTVIEEAAESHDWDLRNLDYALWQWGGNLYRNDQCRKGNNCD